ncbi:MAG: YgiQ family radical SAM protein [Sedimentisphaerales bacterium]|nr:YgiQ family radical SAM protein [Sedimentisphaerales bacterium]
MTTRRPTPPVKSKPSNDVFLPMTAEEMRHRGWGRPDIILVTGDAYVDHPSFGIALIGRRLEHLGYRVAILAQPDWRSVDAFRQFDPPRLFWGITSGAVDARLNAYTSMGHRRSQDVYSPGGKTGLRPDRPLLTYAARAREAFKGIPIILGGLEASLRRLVHYDYIEDKLKRSVLIDAKADLLVFGMAEWTISAIARRLAAGEAIESITNIPGTVWPLTHGRTAPENALEIPSLTAQNDDPQKVLRACLDYHRYARPDGPVVIQQQDPGTIVIMPPAPPLTTEQLDEIYDLPFARREHPVYVSAGGVPALETVRHSITAHRGCGGGCHFCALYLHQGKQITSRSQESIMGEVERLSRHPDFRGAISDVGGPTANMYGHVCTRDCTRTSCLFPAPCPYIKTNNDKLLELMNILNRWRYQNGTHIYIASGVRYDLALAQGDYLDLLCRDFVGGHLKVAPEHCCDDVLAFMGKPPFEVFEQFQARFNDISRKTGKEQYLVPYFISAHPGCTLDHAQCLYDYLVRRHQRLQQVQDFTPIPMTISTAMFVSRRDTRGHIIPVARGRSEKRAQMALLKYHDPHSRKILHRLKDKHKTRRKSH